jgi:putative transposase
MGRQLRIEFPGAFYHVTSRGNQQQAIVKDDQDRHTFLDCLGRAHDKFGGLIHTFCLMDNHFHLFIETPRGHLSRIMHLIKTSYSLYYNSRYSRVGHLFQGRFNAILIDADSYAMAVSRYIHLNPFRAGHVSDPRDYPWSSILEFVGNRVTQRWLKVDFVLSLFNENKAKAQLEYAAFVQDGVLNPPKNPIQDTESSLILGSQSFNEEIKKKMLAQKTISREVPAIAKLKQKATLEEISQTVESALGQNNRFTRDAAIFLTHTKSDYPLKEIARFHSLSFSAVNAISRKMRKNLGWNIVVRNILEHVENELFPNLKENFDLLSPRPKVAKCRPGTGSEL